MFSRGSSAKNRINANHVSHVFWTRLICMKFLHLERRQVDGEIIVSQTVITALFRRFVGRQPNYPPENFNSLDPYQIYQERSRASLWQCRWMILNSTDPTPTVSIL